MGIIKTLLGWAGTAWGAIGGIQTDIANALDKLWHYITAVHGVLSWVMGNPVVKFYRTVLENLTALALVLAVIRDVLRRMAGWIWVHEVRPVRDQLRQQIAQLRAWTAQQLAILTATMIGLYLASLAYTRAAVAVERADRIKAVQAEHAAMLAGDKATLATVQKQAVSGYDAGARARVGVAGRLLDDLVTRTPIIKDLVDLAIKAALDLIDTEQPELAWLANKAVDQLVNKVGIDRLAAQYAQTLLAPVIGGKPPQGLHDVVGDLDTRLAAVEKQWAEFMQDGGPEILQAGEEWKQLTGPLADLGVLAFVALAVAEPAAWSAAIADTVGVAGDAALTAVVDLIGGL